MKEGTLRSKTIRRQAISFAGTLTSGMAIAALALMVVMSFGSKASTAAAAETVTICHAGATLTIPVSQISTYFKGGAPVTAGDYMGPCKTPAKPAVNNAASTAGTETTTQQAATPPARPERGIRENDRPSIDNNGGNNGGNSRSNRESSSNGPSTNATPAVTTPATSPSPVPSAVIATNQSSSSSAAAERLVAIINGLGGNQPRNSAPPPAATPEVQASPVVVAEAKAAPTWTQQVQSVQNLNVSGGNQNGSSGDANRRGNLCDSNNPGIANLSWCDNGNVGGNNPCDNDLLRAQFDWCDNNDNDNCDENRVNTAGLNGCHDNNNNGCDNGTVTLQSGSRHCGDLDCDDYWFWWCGNVGGHDPCDLVPDGRGGYISPCRSCDTIDNVILGGCGGFNCHFWDSRFGDWDDWKLHCHIGDDDFCDNWDQAISYGAWLNNCHNGGCDNWDKDMGSWDNWNNWCNHDPCDKDWDWNWNGRGKHHEEWSKNNYDRDCRDHDDDHDDDKHSDNIDAVVVVCDDGSRHVIDFNRHDKKVVRYNGKYDDDKNGHYWDGKHMRDKHNGDVIVFVCPQVKPTIVVHQVVNIAPVLQQILPQTVSPVVQQVRAQQQQQAPAQPTAVLASMGVRPPSTGDAGVERIIPLDPQTPTAAPAAVTARGSANTLFGLGLAAGAFVIVLGLFRLRTSTQRE